MQIYAWMHTRRSICKIYLHTFMNANMHTCTHICWSRVSQTHTNTCTTRARTYMHTSCPDRKLIVIRQKEKHCLCNLHTHMHAYTVLAGSKENSDSSESKTLSMHLTRDKLRVLIHELEAARDVMHNVEWHVFCYACVHLVMNNVEWHVFCYACVYLCVNVYTKTQSELPTVSLLE